METPSVAAKHLNELTGLRQARAELLLAEIELFRGSVALSDHFYQELRLRLGTRANVDRAADDLMAAGLIEVKIVRRMVHLIRTKADINA